MGREAQARKLRRVVGSLSTQEAAVLSPAVATQYRVRTRTLRRAVFYRMTGSMSWASIGGAFLAHRGEKKGSFVEAVQWCAQVRAAYPAWRPGDPVPEMPSAEGYPGE